MKIKVPSEETNWINDRQYYLLHNKENLFSAERCVHFLSGMCCESLDAGRTWTCALLRRIDCSKYEKINANEKS